MVPHMYAVYFTQSLAYLERANRLGKSQSMLGAMLGIKPFLTIEEGEIIPIEKVRTREKAIEEGRRSYAARTAKSFFQVQSNPAFDTWVANGAFGSPQMVAEWLLPWFKIRKTVPSMSTLIVRFCSLDDVTQARRFHEEVMPLIRHAL